ncbi:hypothetical protein LZ30DRAFT_4476 [Colletotrichum cereale]|nr:hypothetical protein LZ30DRAFT_4476 [Colletotrichum cereale]
MLRGNGLCSYARPLAAPRSDRIVTLSPSRTRPPAQRLGLPPSPPNGREAIEVGAGCSISDSYSTSRFRHGSSPPAAAARVETTRNVERWPNSSDLLRSARCAQSLSDELGIPLYHIPERAPLCRCRHSRRTTGTPPTLLGSSTDTHSQLTPTVPGQKEGEGVWDWSTMQGTSQTGEEGRSDSPVNIFLLTLGLGAVPFYRKGVVSSFHSPFRKEERCDSPGRFGSR